MNRVDIQDRLTQEFENNTYYSVEDKNDSIQDGYDEVAAFSGLFMKGIVLPFTSNKTYYDMIALVPDYLGVYALFNTITKRWMLPTSLRKLANHRPDWECAFGTPELFVPVSHRYVAIYRKSAELTYGNMFMFYVASAPTLGDSTTIEIPTDFDGALLEYTRTDLWEQAQEFSKAVVNFKAYVEELELLRVWIQNQRNPARMGVLREN